MKGDATDPKALIREAYRIDGITPEQCRSIFLDWALSYEGETGPAIRILLEQYGAAADHPMTQTLKDGLGTAQAPRRRGGRAGRGRAM